MYEYVFVGVLFFLLLALIERYMYVTSKAALIERKKLIKLINDYRTKENKNRLIEKAMILLFHESINHFFIWDILKSFCIQENKKEAAEVINGFDPKDKEILQEFFKTALKVNVLAFPLRYSLVLVLLIFLFVIAIVSLMLIGKIKKVIEYIDNFFNNNMYNSLLRPTFKSM